MHQPHAKLVVYMNAPPTSAVSCHAQSRLSGGEFSFFFFFLEKVVGAVGPPIECRIWQATTSAVPCTPIPFQMMVPYSDYTPQGLLCKNIAHTCGVVYKKLPGTHAFCVRMIYTMPVLIQKVI